MEDRAREKGTGEVSGPPGGRRNLALRLGLSLALLWAVLRRADLHEILRAIASVDVRWLAAAFLLHLAGYLFSAWRWQGLLAARGRSHGIVRLSEAILVGTFFNFFLPTTIGGDLVRAAEEAELSKRSLAESLGVVTMDRLAGVVALLLLALAASAFGLESSSRDTLFWGSLVLGVVALGILGLLAGAGLLEKILPRVPHPLDRPLSRISRLLAVFRSLLSTPGVAARAVAISLVFHLNVILHYVFIARALGIGTPALQFFIIVPVVLFILQIPLSLNGIGYREGGFSLMLAGVGVGADRAVALAWLDLAMALTLGVLGGLVFLARGGRLPGPLASAVGMGKGSRKGARR